MGKENRPWQATALGVIDVIVVIALGIFVLFYLFFPAMFTFSVTIAGVSTDSVATWGILGILIFLLFGVLAVFMAMGAFRGEKWSPIVSLLLSAIAVLGLLVDYVNFASQILTFLINVFVIYCAVVCLQHPYFNKDQIV